jgi:hypothetical protein
MAQVVECLPSMPKAPSSAKHKPCMVIQHTCSYATGEVEARGPTTQRVWGQLRVYETLPFFLKVHLIDFNLNCMTLKIPKVRIWRRGAHRRERVRVLHSRAQQCQQFLFKVTNCAVSLPRFPIIVYLLLLQPCFFLLTDLLLISGVVTVLNFNPYLDVSHWTWQITFSK